MIVAGAGFGKSSLLAQACDENRLAPRGDDCWLGCGRGDADPRTFAHGVAGALGADPARLTEAGDDDPAALAGPLADAMWARSPWQVCLVVDDVHEIGDGPAAAVLAALVDALPANGHLVLSGRLDPPVPLARLVAQGLVDRLDESDLAFGDADLAAFVSLRQVPVDRLGDMGGWPALVELRGGRGGRRRRLPHRGGAGLARSGRAPGSWRLSPSSAAPTRRCSTRSPDRAPTWGP